MAAALDFGSSLLGQLENIAQVAQLGQNHAHQREAVWWAQRSYLLDSQSVRLDALDHAKEEIKSHYDTYVGRIDTLLLVLALIFPFALNVIQFSDPFVPASAEDCPECIEAEFQWLVTLWSCLIGIVLVLPFWGILMLIRCKLQLDRWLEFSLAGLHQQRRHVVPAVRLVAPTVMGFEDAEADAGEKGQDEETQQIVYKLVNMTLGYQEYLAKTWQQELGRLVHASTVLLWLSASSALMLTALSTWIFLMNKGGAHTSAGYWFALIMTGGCAAPLLYMAWQAFGEEIEAPNFEGFDQKESSIQDAYPLARNVSKGGFRMVRPTSPLPSTTRGARALMRRLGTPFGLCARRRPDDSPGGATPGRAEGAAATEPLLG